MNVKTTQRGFELIELPTYLEPHDDARLVQQSSAIGDYGDAYDRPGSSFLWVGDKHHLNREQVAELVAHLQAWLATGSLTNSEGCNPVSLTFCLGEAVTPEHLAMRVAQACQAYGALRPGESVVEPTSGTVYDVTDKPPEHPKFGKS